MSNVSEYKDIIAFHPGYYIAEIIEDMGITQEEFAIRLGTTPKTISKLVNGEANLSQDLMQKLESMLGLSLEFWMNLQNKYQKKIAEVNAHKNFITQESILQMIDYNYFVKQGFLPESKSKSERIAALCRFLKIANLNILTTPDFLVNFRSDVVKPELTNLVNSRVWLQTAMNVAEMQDVKTFQVSVLKNHLQEIKQMTLQEPAVFLPRLKEIFVACGIAFVLLPGLKNAKINGAVKWVGREKVLLAMNNKSCYADEFWFSLFHEIKHILQQKLKMTIVNSTVCDYVDEFLEVEADEFASNYLISRDAYQEFVSSADFTENSIVAFAQKNDIHAGIVVGRLQNDKLIPASKYNKLRVKYDKLI